MILSAALDPSPHDLKVVDMVIYSQRRTSTCELEILVASSTATITNHNFNPSKIWQTYSTTLEPGKTWYEIYHLAARQGKHPGDCP
jgi:hypothetical protein